MFSNVQELLEDAKAYPSIAELMIAEEIEQTGASREQIIEMMEHNLATMMSSIEEGLLGNKSTTGLTGGDAKKMDEYIKSGKAISGDVILGAARDGVAVNEVNAQMGLICATPTAGSAGCLPGVLSAATKKLGLTHAGAEGGCQAEVGSASAMSAAALVIMAGGTGEQAGIALALTLQNMLGLICDPVAGLVEIPCVHRNAMGASQAMISADMALAGVKTVIPVDEVITCMYNVGRSLPSAHRETGEGGLAATPTGREIMERIFGDGK